jgi:hypothetical protein
MKILAFLISVFLINNQIFSQTDSLKEIKSNHLLKLYFLNGYGVIYQFNETQFSSFRLHIDISTDGFDSNEERSSSNLGTDTSKSDFTGDITKTSFVFQFSPQYYFNLISKEYFNFYSGLGLLFAYGFSNETNKNSSLDTYSTNFYSYSNTNSKKYDLGLLCFVGVEGKINDNLGIFSEIELKGGKSWSNYDRQSEQTFIPNSGSHFFTESSEEKSFYELSKVRLGVYILL